jgi:hypothetical protein
MSIIHVTFSLETDQGVVERTYSTLPEQVMASQLPMMFAMQVAEQAHKFWEQAVMGMVPTP